MLVAPRADLHNRRHGAQRRRRISSMCTQGSYASMCLCLGHIAPCVVEGGQSLCSFLFPVYLESKGGLTGTMLCLRQANRGQFCA